MSNILNTAYAVTVDTLATENGVTIENGVLHVYNDKLKVHLHDEILNMALFIQLKRKYQQLKLSMLLH